MKHTEDAARSRVVHRHERALARARASQASAQHDASFLASLASRATATKGHALTLERWAASGLALSARPDPLYLGIQSRDVTPAVLRLVRAVDAVSPRLIDNGVLRALIQLASVPFLRDPETWIPRGKGRRTLLRALAHHVLAAFPVPSVLLHVLFEAGHDASMKLFVPMVGHVAKGGSFYRWMKESSPIALTRPMCHELLTSSGERGFLDAVRWVQCRTAGGDARLFEAWRVLRYARLQAREDEAFWSGVLEWFARHGDVERRLVGPLCDYVAEKRRLDASFAMRGRSPRALLRTMRDWHVESYRARAVPATIYRTSGFLPKAFDDYVRVEPNGERVREIWRVREVLTARTLFDEGRRMGHCVASYGWRIERGDTSIWAIVMEDGKGETGAWAMVTVEVRNDLRRVVQARGRFNRLMTTRERQVLGRWAALNNLAIDLGERG